MNSLATIPLFPSGRLVATPGALALLEQTNKSPLEFLSRHLRGDWGDLEEEDKTENELSPFTPKSNGPFDWILRNCAPNFMVWR
jgi:hypothetical protein